MYTIPGCHACEQVRLFLERLGVSAVVKDVTVDRAAARELVLARRGIPRSVGVFPLVVIAGRVVVGFDEARLRALLLPEGGQYGLADPRLRLDGQPLEPVQASGEGRRRASYPPVGSRSGRGRRVPRGDKTVAGRSGKKAGLGEGSAPASPSSVSAPASDDERPLPFVLRVGERWADIREAPGPGEGIPLMFRRRASLTGNLAFTQNGQDVEFSDIGVAAEES